MKKTPIIAAAAVLTVSALATALTIFSPTLAESNQTGRHQLMQEKRVAMDAALESRDFATWQAAVQEQNPESDLLTKITAENFSQFLKLYDLRQEVQKLHEEMKVISDELEIKPEGHKMKKGFGHGKFQKFRGEK